MRKILSEKLVVLVVALNLSFALIPLYANSCSAAPEKANAPALSKTKQSISKPPAVPSTKQLDGSAAQGADQSAGEHHSRRDGAHRHHHRDGIPSFRAIKHLQSLNEVQKSKVNEIIKQAKQESNPMMKRLKQIKNQSRAAAGQALDAGKPGSPGAPATSAASATSAKPATSATSAKPTTSAKPATSVAVNPASTAKERAEASELKRRIREIRKNAWLKLQKLLTEQQKIELASHRDEEKHRRHHDEELMEGKPDTAGERSK